MCCVTGIIDVVACVSGFTYRVERGWWQEKTIEIGNMIHGSGESQGWEKRGKALELLNPRRRWQHDC
jgi:hypothetical protein